MTELRSYIGAKRASRPYQIAIVGCGNMAKAAAYMLAQDNDVARIILIDRDRERAEELVSWLHQKAPASEAVLQIVEGDVSDIGPSLGDLVKGTDAIGLAMPWPATRSALSALLPTGVPLASITRPNYAEMTDIAEEAVRVGGRAILPIGLEPGLTEILGVEAASRHAHLKHLIIHCGGIPAAPRPPLNHTILFGRGLAVAMRPAYAVKGGKLITCSRFDELEEVRFDDIGTLEAHHDGLLPWLPEDSAIKNAQSVSQKTLRWPGYTDAIRCLHSLGLLDETPISIDGATVSPKRVVDQVLAPSISRREDDIDITIIRVSADGGDALGATTIQCIDYADPESGLSSMARTTGFTFAATLEMLAAGTIQVDGLTLPHEIIRGAAARALLDRLRHCGLRITEEGAQ